MSSTTSSTTSSEESFRIVSSVHFSRARLALARRYASVTGAVADMGDGIVVSADGHRIVAFHERHLAFVEHAVTSGRLTT